jgi:hypothetical protein
MASREAALERRKDHARFWTAPHTMENLLDSIEAMICAPVSAVTNERLAVQTADRGEALSALAPITAGMLHDR